MDGSVVGGAVVFADGSEVGMTEGSAVVDDGTVLGVAVGAADGSIEKFAVGSVVGVIVSCALVGLNVGAPGPGVGLVVDGALGFAVGTAIGTKQSTKGEPNRKVAFALPEPVCVAAVYIPTTKVCELLSTVTTAVWSTTCVYCDTLGLGS